MSQTDSYTQVMLQDADNGRLVCWVETVMAQVGKRVVDEFGANWTVSERYVTWPKSRLDDQRRTVMQVREVLK